MYLCALTVCGCVCRSIDRWHRIIWKMAAWHFSKGNSLSYGSINKCCRFVQPHRYHIPRRYAHSHFQKFTQNKKEKLNQIIFMQISTKHVSFFFLFFIEKKRRKQYANCLLIFKLYLSNHLIQRNFPYAFFLWTFFFFRRKIRHLQSAKFI